SIALGNKKNGANFPANAVQRQSASGKAHDTAFVQGVNLEILFNKSARGTLSKRWQASQGNSSATISLSKGVASTMLSFVPAFTDPPNRSVCTQNHALRP